MDVSSAILFPHTFIRSEDLEAALRHYRPLSICLPWHMESPFSRTDSPYAPSIVIRRPQPSLKPPGDFGAVLSGYVRWAEEHRQGGYAAFIKALQDGLAAEETSWEIGRMIRGASTAARDGSAEKSLRWHLVLRLAHEMEESRNGAEDLLRRVKGMRSPLEEALGGEPSGPGPIADLPPFSSDPPAPGQRLDRIVEAFTGLFGAHMRSRDLLLTLNPLVLEHLRERFVASAEEIILHEAGAAAAECRMTALRLGGPEGTAEDLQDPVPGALSGKTIVLMETVG